MAWLDIWHLTTDSLIESARLNLNWHRPHLLLSSLFSSRSSFVSLLSLFFSADLRSRTPPPPPHCPPPPPSTPNVQSMKSGICIRQSRSDLIKVGLRRSSPAGWRVPRLPSLFRGLPAIDDQAPWESAADAGSGSGWWMAKKPADSEQRNEMQRKLKSISIEHALKTSSSSSAKELRRWFLWLWIPN